jgi:hypothetical protein
MSTQNSSITSAATNKEIAMTPRRKPTAPLPAFVATALLALALALLALAPAASAQGAAQWAITATAGPTSFAPGDSEDVYTIAAINTGAGPTDGTPVTVADVLPAGVTATNVVGSNLFTGGIAFELFGSGQVSCEQASVSCTFEGAFDTGDELIMTVSVSVGSSLSGSVTDTASVSGGGTPGAQASTSMQIGGSTPFGFAPGAVLAATSTSQAGAHPNVTVSFTLARNTRIVPVAEPRDTKVELPPGLVGSATATPRCTMNTVQLGTCPSGAMVGIATVTVNFFGQLLWSANPVYSITPYVGEPAAFAFSAVPGLPVRLDTSVRSGSDFGVTTASSKLSGIEPVLGTTVTLWGVPGEHNGPGPDTAYLDTGPASFGGPGSAADSAPLFTNPTTCGGPQSVDVSADSWPLGTTSSQTASSSVALPAVTGCGALQFDPSVTVRPETTVADSPTGIEAEIKVPQDENPDALATPDVRDTTVTLPAGFALSPPVADGLQGCSAAQIALSSTAPATCPQASQVGTVEIVSPALPDPLVGQIFLGMPNCSPCTLADAQDGNMVHAYLQAQGSGVILKLPGSFTLDPNTGQITTHFLNTPQQPFSDLKLHFKGGPRATVATPESCGVFTASSDLTPWSAPESGPDATPFDSFEISSGCGGGFAPAFTAGTTNNAAGGFSPLSVTFSRQDGEQGLGAVTVRTPPGLLGVLKSVPLCGEPQAAQGTCGQESLIGHTTVASGAGPDPFYLGGSVYLTGPYKGAPFGLSIVVPAIAGPFNLGNVVVRAAISVDPSTTALTVTSDPLPTILDGIPLRLRTVNVTIDRPGFIFNPTSCEPMSLAATITSTQGTAAPVSSRFQAAGCAALAFHPVFSASSLAKTSREGGAALDVKVSYPSGAQANIHSVAVTLPVQLPARLSTIQQACPEATFNANPASCDAGSMIGVGTAVTPIFNNPLTGPAYLVSHGGAAFPDIDVVLQGEGVTLDLVGHVNISKSGVTSATFSEVPDAPISSFDLNLPEGPHSGLSAVGSLCAQPLSMPTTITAQNGAQIKQTTSIKVTGCPAVKTKKKPKKKKKHKKSKKARKSSARRGK